MGDLSDSNQQSWEVLDLSKFEAVVFCQYNIRFLISGLSLAGLAHHGSHESLW